MLLVYALLHACSGNLLVYGSIRFTAWKGSFCYVGKVSRRGMVFTPALQSVRVWRDAHGCTRGWSMFC